MLLHAAVGDCAVVGLEDELKGVVPLALCVLKNGETCVRWVRAATAAAVVSPAAAVVGVRRNPEEISGEIVKLVRDTVGPVAAFRKVLFVRALPKTRSGKIPRASLGNLVNGKPYKVRLFETTLAVGGGGEDG